MTRIRSVDFESYLVAPGLAPAPAICMSHCEIIWDDLRQAWRRTEGEVVLWREALALLKQWLLAGDCFVGANTWYEVACSVFSDPEAPEDFMRLWVEALDADRCTDVLLRQTLLDFSIGYQANRYNLGSVSKQLGVPTQPDKRKVCEHCGLADDAPGMGCDFCPMRLRYHYLDGIAVHLWPERARRYSLEDALCTAECWIAQEHLRAQGSPYFPGRDPLKDQYRQQRGAIALGDISSSGRRSHAPTVKRFKAWAEAKRDALRERLTRGIVDWKKLDRIEGVPEGEALTDRFGPRVLVRTEYKRDYQAIAKLGQLPLTAAGKPSLAAGKLAASQDERIRALRDWPRSAPYLHAQGLATCAYKISRKVAEQRIVLAYAAQGRGPLLKVTEIKDERGKKIGQRETVRQDNDACTQSRDPLLRDFCEYNSLVTLLGSPMSLLEKSAHQPWHVHYTPCVSTGRTASGGDEDEDEEKGNDQNHNRKPGLRECYAPTDAPEDGWEAAKELLAGKPYPGELIFDADFSAVELHAFAQNCFEWVGWSRLGDQLNTFDPPLEGETKGSWHDVHLEIASLIAQISYDEARRNKKNLKDERTGGKGVNFGRKGGMGAKKLVAYFWNNYGVDLGKKYPDDPNGALKFAQELVDYHDKITPEFPYYSAIVKSFARNPHDRMSKHDLVHPYSERLKAGLGYTDVHNYPFQGRAADLAKLALWEVFKARWGCNDLGKADPLYRCKIVQFTHDSITGTAPSARAPAAARRLGELMERASRVVLPLCPSRAEPSLSTRLSKNAEPIFGPDGELKPFDPWVHVWEASVQWATYLDGNREKGKRPAPHTAPLSLELAADLAAWLEKKSLPPYCIEDIVNSWQTTNPLAPRSTPAA
jgi:hypothetical protein